MEDLSIDGPGSPISLKKVLKEVELKPFTFFVDGSGQGIAPDDESCIYITPAECTIQALHYSKNVFDGRRVPEYLYRYLSYMFDVEPIMNSKAETIIAFNTGVINEETPGYKHIVNLIKYCDSNDEARQIIGLIQLIAGTLNMARKNKSGVRLYIDKPETSLHPKRQSRCVNLLMKLREEFGDEEIKGET